MATKANPLKHFNDQYDKRAKKFDKGGPVTGPNSKEYDQKIAAGKKAGWKEDQVGAFKNNLTDTASVTYLKSPKGEYAGVKKPKK